jgi:ubiquinone/menaquinone biosynthesis C-methylase UbiE
LDHVNQQSLLASPFDSFASEYDRWFDSHPFAYQSEIEAIRRFIPSQELGVEIGVGTGRFSSPFSIAIGADPSESMAAIARSRGITVHLALAERLPFQSEHFDFALMVTTLCFVQDPHAALGEIHRILKPNGLLILAIIDKETPLGKRYEAMKSFNKFYAKATFYSTQQVLDLLRQNGSIQPKTRQTIFSNPESMIALDPIRDGYGEGAFVVIRSIRQSKETK